MSVECVSVKLATSNIDYTEAMKVSVDLLALKDLTMLPSDIWINVADLLDCKATVYRGLTKDQVVSQIYRIRKETSGADIFQKIEDPSFSMIKGSNFHFLISKHVISAQKKQMACTNLQFLEILLCLIF